MSEPRHISVARIIRARGNRGEVAAELLTSFPARFEALRAREVSLQKENTPRLSLVLESYWFHRRNVILKFQGIGSISEAQALKDYELQVPRDEVVPLAQGVYYQFEVLGCMVKDLRGFHYGVVKEVLEQGSSCLLKVDSGKREILIPFAEELLVRIDTKAKELVVDLPEGLVDL